MNYYYRNTISDFLLQSTDEIIGTITRSNEYDVVFQQNKSWEQQIPVLKNALSVFDGEIFFEFSIPRMGNTRFLRTNPIIPVGDILVLAGDIGLFKVVSIKSLTGKHFLR